MFARDIYMRSNYILGGYFEMLFSGWKRKESPNMLFVWYEELKQDQRSQVIRMMDHIGHRLKEEKVTELCEAMTFSNYKNISSLNARGDRVKEGEGDFTRKGVVGDWVNYFDADLNQLWDGWIRENLASIGITEEKIMEYFSLV